MKMNKKYIGKPNKKKFKIVVEYKTGDSFSSFYTSNDVELKWESYEKANDSLNRIKIYNEFYDRFLYKAVDEKVLPSFIKVRNGSFLDLILETDEGKEFRFHPFWVGYFERFIGAEII